MYSNAFVLLIADMLAEIHACGDERFHFFVPRLMKTVYSSTTM
jgi:hypothetical protein